MQKPFFSLQLLLSGFTHCHTLLATLLGDSSQLWLQKVQVAELLQEVQIPHLHHLRNDNLDSAEHTNENTLVLALYTRKGQCSNGQEYAIKDSCHLPLEQQQIQNP